MQISVGEVEKILRRGVVPGARGTRAVGSLQDLADEHGVEPGEVERQAVYVRSTEEDPWRERRVRELKARVEAGAYHVETGEILDMAERRAIADRADRW
jgi:anti-sigma28 factor (negative regulator of flagellin synthesis)